MHFLRIQWAIERKPLLDAGFTKSLCSLFLLPKNAVHQSKSNFKAKLTGNFTSFFLARLFGSLQRTSELEGPLMESSVLW